MKGKLVGFVCVLVVGMAQAGAATIFPPGQYPDLDDQIRGHERQFYLLSAYPFGLSLDVHPRDAAAVGAIDAFLGQDESDDIEAVTGSHVFELLHSYGEYGDLGFFGGVALVGTAFRYMALKKEGADTAVLEDARNKVVRAARSWHIFKVVTGGGGLVARGIRRLVPEDPEDPPIPDATREPVPLADEDGLPLPQPKDNGSWRADLSDGALPEGEWMWVDSCSKDQLIGQIYAMTVLYDAMKDDPDIDQSLVTQLQDDARLIAGMLMTERDVGELAGAVGEGMYDLIIMDADGRPTMYHDLNPYSLEKLYMDPAQGRYNLFNLIMTIGAIKGLHHITGDEDIEHYLYEELLGERGFLGMVLGTSQDGAIDYLYAGNRTNFDVPDMSSIALWLALYNEVDPEVTAVMRAFLEERWWDREGETRTARLCKQPLWHAIYLTLTDRGTDSELADELRRLLLDFDLGPYWNPARINCDEDEIAARECLAVDGETVLSLAGRDGDGDWMAVEALDPSIRPPSNFDARSNPFQVNGGGGLRLNPGGDLLAAYWIARFMDATEAGNVHVSPNAREHMPVGGWPEPPVEPTPDTVDAGATDVAGGDETVAPGEDIGVDGTAADLVPGSDGSAGSDTTTSTGGGGGCRTGGPTTFSPLALFLLAGWFYRRRRLQA